MTSPRGFAVLAAAIAALALPATAAAKPKVTITGDSINNYAFSPSKVKVSKGAKVRWSWDSNTPQHHLREARRALAYQRLGLVLAQVQGGGHVQVPLHDPRLPREGRGRVARRGEQRDQLKTEAGRPRGSGRPSLRPPSVSCSTE